MLINYYDLCKYHKVRDWTIKNIPQINISESISPNQISSKLWLVQELKKTISNIPLNIEIVGGWFGWPLIGMLYKEFDIEKIFMYDIDKNACRVAIQYREIFNKNKDDIWILNENYWTRSVKRYVPNLVINCSSEHMKETFYEFNNYSKDCIFAIQSNNMFHIEDHVNCVEDEDDMIFRHGIRNIVYSGNQNIIEWDGFEIKDSTYKRFMVIGKI